MAISWLVYRNRNFGRRGGGGGGGGGVKGGQGGVVGGMLTKNGRESGGRCVGAVAKKNLSLGRRYPPKYKGKKRGGGGGVGGQIGRG